MYAQEDVGSTAASPLTVRKCTLRWTGSSPRTPRTLAPQSTIDYADVPNPAELDDGDQAENEFDGDDQPSNEEGSDHEEREEEEDAPSKGEDEDEGRDEDEDEDEDGDEDEDEKPRPRSIAGPESKFPVLTEKQKAKLLKEIKFGYNNVNAMAHQLSPDGVILEHHKAEEVRGGFMYFLFENGLHWQSKISELEHVSEKERYSDHVDIRRQQALKAKKDKAAKRAAMKAVKGMPAMKSMKTKAKTTTSPSKSSPSKTTPSPSKPMKTKPSSSKTKPSPSKPMKTTTRKSGLKTSPRALLYSKVYHRTAAKFKCSGLSHEEAKAKGRNAALKACRNM